MTWTPPPDEQGTTPHQPAVAPATPVAGLPVLEGHEILSLLGQGGMGVVYKARHLSLDRLVALKMILGGGHAAPTTLERFRLEAQAIARLQHPNIVQIYEVGAHQGQPYFTLEYIDGGNLRDRLREQPLPAREAAQLVETLARAIQVAHQAGIVHRDLKPANVLLAAGQPKITDFGLAKQLDSDAGQTQSGAIMGTPSYMAPEQAFGQTAAISPLVDVYALGAILYEALTGRPPFRAATVIDTLDQVRHQAPVPPRQLQPKVPLDLEIICLKCLEKTPAARYSSALALAEDLARFLADEPIRARPTPLWERIWKGVKRRPAVTVLGVLSVLLLLAGLATGWLQYRTTAEALETARTNLYFNRIGLARSHISAGRVERAQELLAECPADLRGWEWNYLHRQCDTQVRQERLTYTEAALWQLSPDGSMVVGSGLDQVVLLRLPGGEVLHRHKLADRFDPREGAFLYCSFDPTGRFIAAARNRHLYLWSVADGRLVAHLQGTPSLFALSPGATRVVRNREVWDVATATQIATLQLPPGFPAEQADQWYGTCFAFSADGKTIFAGLQSSIDWWDADTGEHRGSVPAPVPTALVVCPDGQRLGALVMTPGARMGTVFLWALADLTQPPLLVKGSESRLAPVFSPDSKWLALSGAHHNVRIWDVQRGEAVISYPNQKHDITGVAFAANGKRLVTLNQALEVKEWEINENREARTLAAGASVAAFSSDGRWLAAVENGTVNLLDVDSAKLRQTLGPLDGTITGVGFNPDTTRLLVFTQTQNPAPAASETQLSVWETSTGKRIFSRSLPGHSGRMAEAAWSPEGDRVALCWRDLTANIASQVSVLEIPSGQQLFHTRGAFVVGPQGRQLAFSPDGHRLALGTYELLKGALIVWDLDNGQQLFKVNTPLLPFVGARFSRDGKILIGTTQVGDHLYNAQSGVEITCSPPESSALLLPDGRILSYRAGDGELHLFDAASGKLRCVLKDYEADGPPLVSPDGRRLLALGRTLKMWDLTTGQEVLALSRPETAPPGSDLEFSTDGTRLLHGTTVWDARPPENRAEELTHAAPGPPRDRRDFWMSVLWLVVGFWPVLYLSRLYSLAVRVRLYRRHGWLPTSFGLGVARPLLMTNWYGSKVALARERPLRPFLSVFPLSLFPTHSQRAWISVGHLVLLALTAGGCYLAWRYLPWGWEIAFLALGLLTLAALKALCTLVWLGVRGPRGDNEVMEAIVQLRTLRGVWKWIGDTTGLYLKSMQAAGLWAELGAPGEAQRLLAEADALAVDHTPFTQAYGETMRAVVLSASGQYAPAHTALRLAEMGFGALEHEPGRVLVALGRVNLLRREGKSADALGLLDALRLHPLHEASADLRARVCAEQLLCALALEDTHHLEQQRSEFERNPGSPVAALTVWQALVDYQQKHGEKSLVAPLHEHAEGAARDIYAMLGDEERTIFQAAQGSRLSDQAPETVFAAVTRADQRRATARAWWLMQVKQAMAFLLVMDLFALVVTLIVLPLPLKAGLPLMLLFGAYEQFAVIVLAWFCAVNLALLAVYVPFRLGVQLLTRLLRPQKQTSVETPLPPTLSDLPTIPPDERTDPATTAVEQPVPPRSGWFALLLWLVLGGGAVVMLFSAATPAFLTAGAKRIVLEVLLLCLGFLPLIKFAALIEQVVLMLLCRLCNQRVTSIVAGTGRQLAAWTLGTLHLSLHASEPWVVQHHAYARNYTATRREWLRFVHGLMVMHLLLLTAFLFLAYSTPYGTLLCLWGALFNVFCLHTLWGKRKQVRDYGAMVQPTSVRLRAHNQALERLRACDDHAGRVIYLLDLAMIWSDLGNQSEGARLCQEAEQIDIADHPDATFLDGCRLLVRSRFAREQGDHVQARRKLETAQQLFRAASAALPELMCEWSLTRVMVEEGDTQRAGAALNGLAQHAAFQERPLLRLILLADQIRAEAAQPESLQLPVLLESYETHRRLHPGPHFEVMDLKVYRDVARYHLRRGDGAAASAAHRQARAALRTLDEQLSFDPHWQKLFRAGQAPLRGEIAESLQHLSAAPAATVPQPVTVAPPPSEVAPQTRWKYVLMGWLMTLANLLLALVILTTVRIDPEAMRAEIAADAETPGLSALRRPATQGILAGLLLMSLVPSLACGWLLLVVGLLVPQVWGRGGRLLIGLALLPWLFCGLHLAGLSRPPPNATTPTPELQDNE